MAPDGRKTLMRSLGEFLGHIWHAATADVTGSAGPGPREVRRDVREEQREMPGASVTLRRTTIEEIVVDPKRTPEHRP